jgi:hypothetical protein
MFNPVHWWFIGLFTLSAFYLFVSLSLFFVFWLFVKPRYTFIFIITIAICWKPLRKIVPFNSDVAFIKQKQKNALRIMSWNVAQFNILENKKNPKIKTEMLSLINEYKPDIACFQEMVAADSAMNSKNPFYRKYSFYNLFDFSDTLGLNYNYYCYNPKEDFFDQQHFGIVIFSKFPIINKKKISSFPHDYNSIFEYADIVKGNDTLRVFNIHLQSLKFSKTNLQYLDNPSIESEADIQKSKNIISKLKYGFLKRQVQAERIQEEIKKSPYPIILCGDFNDVPNSYAYETIGQDLNNVFEKRGSGIDRTFSGISPTLRIDNIFVDAKISVLQYTRVRKKLSDHFPVISDVVLTP